MEEYKMWLLEDRLLRGMFESKTEEVKGWRHVAE
jgi:hypothetical protein